LEILNALLAHNYFNFGNEFYQATKGIAMGSPVSELIAEIFLRYYKHLIVNHTAENRNTLFYTRCMWMTYL